MPIGKFDRSPGSKWHTAMLARKGKPRPGTAWKRPAAAGKPASIAADATLTGDHSTNAYEYDGLISLIAGPVREAPAAQAPGVPRGCVECAYWRLEWRRA